MIDKKPIKVALVGNPNTGKTSLFNQLTGLNQKVSNYPGVTVDKKTGTCQLNKHINASILDLPGTYSINATSSDEDIVFDTLVNSNNPDYPDVVMVVTEVVNLKRNLFLFTQIKDLQIPTILVVNMADQITKKGIKLNINKLEKLTKTKVCLVSARKNIGIDTLKQNILDYKKLNTNTIADVSKQIKGFFFENIKQTFPDFSLYKSWLLITQKKNSNFITDDLKTKINFFKDKKVQINKFQHKEAVYRYQIIRDILKESYKIDRKKGRDLRAYLDRILTHKIFGYIIFALILLLIFQSVFAWASVPMDWIDGIFADFTSLTKEKLPEGKLSDLISDGIISGMGGIVIFVPQIVILFLFISILEETGYMSRVVFLMDKIMRNFGMSGKSILPLVSGTACAIPAIMTARNIESWRERLITILVTPFTTCSARLPVYIIIIALVIPKQSYFGIFNLQGLTLMILYLMGFIAAILSGAILHKTLKIKNKSFFVIELPDYQIPSIKNIGLTVLEKTKAFLIGAGKIILSISIILWFLASHGGKKYNQAEIIFNQKKIEINKNTQNLDSYKLEHSYLGNIGKFIEPAIKPLGYDWKIGIALVSSFAAREVFVGTLATIYSVENSDDEATTIKQRMKAEINAEGKPVFNFASGLSLLMYYVFAMQCMGTLAIVKRETNSWKWPIYQVIGMGILAYIFAFLSYQIFK